MLPVYLNWFWGVSVPERVLRDDGFDGDLRRPVAIFDKVGDGAEVDQSPAADPIPAGAPGQLHHAGGQRHIGAQRALVCDMTEEPGNCRYICELHTDVDDGAASAHLCCLC